MGYRFLRQILLVPIHLNEVENGASGKITEMGFMLVTNG